MSIYPHHFNENDERNARRSNISTSTLCAIQEATKLRFDEMIFDSKQEECFGKCSVFYKRVENHKNVVIWFSTKEGLEFGVYKKRTIYIEDEEEYFDDCIFFFEQKGKTHVLRQQVSTVPLWVGGVARDGRVARQLVVIGNGIIINKDREIEIKRELSGFEYSAFFDLKDFFWKPLTFDRVVEVIAFTMSEIPEYTKYLS